MPLSLLVAKTQKLHTNANQGQDDSKKIASASAQPNAEIIPPPVQKPGTLPYNASPASTPNNNPVDLLLLQAEAARKQGDFDTARKHYEQSALQASQQIANQHVQKLDAINPLLNQVNQTQEATRANFQKRQISPAAKTSFVDNIWNVIKAIGRFLAAPFRWLFSSSNSTKQKHVATPPEQRRPLLKNSNDTSPDDYLDSNPSSQPFIFNGAHQQQQAKQDNYRNLRDKQNNHATATTDQTTQHRRGFILNG